MDAKIHSVSEVTVGYTKSLPPALILGASGVAPTSGWRHARLVPRVYVKPPADGVWDFDLIATAPTGIVLQVMTPVASAPFVTDIPEWLRGVRVHASTNSVDAAVDAVAVAVMADAQGTAAPQGGVDILPWRRHMPAGGVDVWPWSATAMLEGGGSDVGGPAELLQQPLSALIGRMVRLHRVSDPVTEDYRPQRVNIVVADDRPVVVRLYRG